MKVYRDEKTVEGTMGMWEGSPSHSQATFLAGGQEEEYTKNSI